MAMYVTAGGILCESEDAAVLQAASERYLPSN